MKKAFLVALSFALLLVASSLIFPFWHSFPIVDWENVGIFLQSYPAQHTDGNLCFTIGFKIPKKSIGTKPMYKIYVNNSLVKYGRFVLTDASQTYCLTNVPDKAIVKYELDSIDVSFHTEKAKEKHNTKIKVLDINSQGILFNVQNPEKYRPLEIYSNGKLIQLIYPSSSGTFFEPLKIEKTSHLSVFYNSQFIKGKDIEVKEFPFVNYFFGLLLFTLVFFSYLLFFQGDFYERIAKAFGAILSYTIVSVFLLNLLNLLSFFSFSLIFSLQLLLFLKRKKDISFPKFTLSEIFVLALFIVIPLFFHLFTYTHITYWNGFYERQAETLAQNFHLQSFDPLSYLGRAMTYIPGYFFFNASFSWLFGSSFPYLLLFANLFFFFSFVFLGKQINLKEKSIFFPLLVATSLFILTGLSLSPRHALSLSLFALALAVLLQNKKHSPFISGILLSIASYIQIPMLLFFPIFFLLMFATKKNVKNLFLSTATALFIFLFIFFLPQFLSFGMPYEVKAKDWGYLIKHTPEYLLGDIPALLGFFFIFFGYDYLKKRKKLSRYSGRLALATALGILIQFFISYRWNIMTAISLSAFIIYEFPSRILKDNQAKILVLIILALVFAPLLSTMAYYAMSGLAKQPIETIGILSSAKDNILSDPLFAHSIAYLSQRKTLADLYVEYADENKLSDAYSFLRNKDYSILQKYKIAYILNQRNIIHSKAIGSKVLDKDICFPELDKIYDNGFIYIHRNQFLS